MPKWLIQEAKKDRMNQVSICCKRYTICIVHGQNRTRAKDVFPEGMLLYKSEEDVIDISKIDVTSCAHVKCYQLSTDMNSPSNSNS